MLKPSFTLLLSLFTFHLFAQPIDQKEWSEYMSHNRLYWDSLGTDFYDGIIAGNGHIGVNMYREGNKALRFDVGRSDVTDNRPHYPDSMFTQQLVSHPRLPIGRMMVRTEGDILKASLFLDIYNAEVNGTVTTTKGTIGVHFTVPSGEEVIHIEINELNSNEKPICEWVGEEAVSPRISYRSVNPKTYDYVQNLQFVLRDSAGFGICYQPLLNDGEYATVYRHALTNKSHVIDLAIGYSTDKKNVAVKYAMADLNKFFSKPYATVLTTHKKWWNAFFQKSFISIPDKKIESYYWLQLYKLASATREDKPMIDLMGPWFTSKTPWPAIWWNLNTQLTYSPLFASNHAELAKPLFDLLNKNKKNLINNVPAQWRSDAAAIGRISTFDLHAPLNQNDLSKGQFEPGDLTWTMLYYYKYAQYTGDAVELKTKIYPLLKRSINYLMHLLYQDDKGVYHMVKSYSPEYADAEDAHYSVSALIWGLQTLLKINDDLKLKDADKSKWNEVLKNLTPLHVNETGFMIGKDVSLTSSHRHYSHLMAIYPYRLLNMDDPMHRKLAMRSIDHWQSMPELLRGYSYTGSAAMYAMLGEGDKSHAKLQNFLQDHAKPGGLYAESGPCFESPMAFATTLLEMLIQSDDQVIRIFPALPDNWKETSFSQLGAEGAFLIDAIRYQGKLQEVKVKSLKGQPCTLDLEGQNEYTLVSSIRGIVVPKINVVMERIRLSFNTQSNETITITRKGAPSAKDLLVHFEENTYYWGLQHGKGENVKAKVKKKKVTA